MFRRRPPSGRDARPHTGHPPVASPPRAACGPTGARPLAPRRAASRPERLRARAKVQCPPIPTRAGLLPGLPNGRSPPFRCRWAGSWWVARWRTGGEVPSRRAPPFGWHLRPWGPFSTRATRGEVAVVARPVVPASAASPAAAATVTPATAPATRPPVGPAAARKLLLAHVGGGRGGHLGAGDACLLGRRDLGVIAVVVGVVATEY